MDAVPADVRTRGDEMEDGTTGPDGTPGRRGGPAGKAGDGHGPLLEGPASCTPLSVVPSSRGGATEARRSRSSSALSWEAGLARDASEVLAAPRFMPGVLGQ